MVTFKFNLGQQVDVVNWIYDSDKWNLSAVVAKWRSVTTVYLGDWCIPVCNEDRWHVRTYL